MILAGIARINVSLSPQFLPPGGRSDAEGRTAATSASAGNGFFRVEVRGREEVRNNPASPAFERACHATISTCSTIW